MYYFFFGFLSRDTTVKLWETESGEFVRNYGGHTEAVNCVQLVTTGKYGEIVYPTRYMDTVL